MRVVGTITTAAVAAAVVAAIVVAVVSTPDIRRYLKIRTM